MMYTIAAVLGHSDGAFKFVPLRGILLLAVKVIPPERRETEFGSLCAAYACLPEKNKRALKV